MDKIIVRFAKVLDTLRTITLGLMGIFLILLLFRELIPISQQIFSMPISKNNEEILDEIIVFFLFFEFAALAIAALMNKGHTSIEFLMELGITALVRSLLTAHNHVLDTLCTSISILLIIVAMVLYHKYGNKDQ
ncbi:phosphate-starvation-inducible PsiE family protein [Lactobacillus sp. PSON]|uniref:phosphate-starvation-inducible PsiE family protein n=1 Tax=Lactobacillus sp. PSON TaxID=3455454 RepID=UPI004042DD03